MSEPLTIRVHTPGWATFGQALPPGWAWFAVQVGDLPTQTNVKCRWPDGSIRFAVVSVQAPEVGEYPLAPDPVVSDPFFPHPLFDACWLELVIDGESWWCGPTAAEIEADPWLDGPLVREGRCITSPWVLRGDEWVEHPFLRVVWDVRTYRDGSYRIGVTVENCLDVASGTSVRYAATLYASDDSGWSWPELTHHYLTRWRTIAFHEWFGVAAPSLEGVFQAKALPRYLPLVTDESPAAIGPTFDPLGSGALNPDMPAHGGRPEIAPYPDWTARALVHQRPEQISFVLTHGDLAGSWPVHVREADGRMVSLDERPNFWLDWRADHGDKPAGDLGQTGPLRPDIAHQPSLAYVPYLLTGDRYYADEMAFWANYVLIGTWPAEPGRWDGRDGARGILAGNQVRGFGWGLRNLVDAAAYLPDDDPRKAYFAERVQNNLDWLGNYAKAVAQASEIPGTPPAPWLDPDKSFLPTLAVAQWGHNYLAWAVDRAEQQGFEGGWQWRDVVAWFQLRMFREWDFSGPVPVAAPYRVGVGRLEPGQQPEWFPFERCFPIDPKSFAGWYGVDARLMLLIGIREGWDGAQAAYDSLHRELAEIPFIDGVPDLARRAGWAIAEA